MQGLTEGALGQEQGQGQQEQSTQLKPEQQEHIEQQGHQEGREALSDERLPQVGCWPVCGLYTARQSVKLPVCSTWWLADAGPVAVSHAAVQRPQGHGPASGWHSRTSALMQ